jgi:hypothetical protein
VRKKTFDKTEVMKYYIGLNEFVNTLRLPRAALRFLFLRRQISDDFSRENFLPPWHKNRKYFF